MEEQATPGTERGLRRRELLVAGGAGALVLASPINYAAIARANRLPMAKGGKFAHGVASGVPSQKGITLWTRVSDLSKSAKLTLEVATDKHFRKIVDTQQVEGRLQARLHRPRAGQEAEAGTEYFYRFDTGDKSSQGRQVPDAGAVELEGPGPHRRPLLPVLHRRLLQRPGRAREGEGPRPRSSASATTSTSAITTTARPTGSTRPAPTATATCRRSTSTARSTASARATRACRRCTRPIRSSRSGTTTRSRTTTRATSRTRPSPTSRLENERRPARGSRSASGARNGYKAFFEAMPRMQQKGDPNAIYGSMKLGGIVELFLTDQRQYRDQQPCDGRPARRAAPTTTPRAGPCSAQRRRAGSRARCRSRRPPGSSGAARSC